MSFTSDDPPEEVDINFVLVHGLDGNDQTFINQNSILNKSFQNYLRTTFPRSKIITYEYQNNSIKFLSSKHPLPIKERAENFAFGLINELNNDKSIHFICHSMGGLIVKEALLTAAKPKQDDSEVNINDLYHQTRSIAFYATPHLGSGLANTLNYINLKYFEDNLVNNVIEELKHDNPFLVGLKNNFNQLISKGQNKNIQILSIIEGQLTTMIGKKVVEGVDAECGLHAQYEQKLVLDFDHSEICKPAQIKDRRFTQFAHFVFNTLKNTKKRNDEEKDDEMNDQKEGYKIMNDDTQTNDFCLIGGVMFKNPSTNDIDDVEIALADYKKKPSVKNITNLISTALKNKTKNYMQFKLDKLLKNNLMKQNTKILNSLLKTQEFMKHVDEKQIHESIKLSNEYWSLLKQSKQIVTDKKSQINKLLKVSQRWKKIIKKRIDFENDEGKAPSKMDAKYMGYVQKSLCNYFSTGTKDTEIMATKWAELTEKLAEQYTWWKNKYEWFKEWKQKQWEKMKEKSKSWWGWMDMISGAIKWLGAAVAVGAAIAAVFMTGGLALVVAGAAFGIGVAAYGVQKLAISQQRGWDSQERKASKVEQCIKQITDAFNTMKKDGAMMDKLFSDFQRLLCEPKTRAKEIEDEVEKDEDELNWYMMEENVDDIIKSLEQLDKVCVDLIAQIDTSQTNFYAE